MVKLINNAVAAINTAVAAEALLLGKRAGVDLDALVRVMSAGSGASAMLELKAGPMRAHDYTTLFKLEHMLKDCASASTRQRRLASGMGFAETRRARCSRRLTSRDSASEDFAALIEVLEQRGGRRGSEPLAARQRRPRPGSVSEPPRERRIEVHDQGRERDREQDAAAVAAEDRTTRRARRRTSPPTPIEDRLRDRHRVAAREARACASAPTNRPPSTGGSGNAMHAHRR